MTEKEKREREPENWRVREGDWRKTERKPDVWIQEGKRKEKRGRESKKDHGGRDRVREKGVREKRQSWIWRIFHLSIRSALS